MSLRRVIKGVTFGVLWYLSVLMGFYFLYCPTLILLFINRRWYRNATDIIQGIWEYYPGALLCVVCGSRVFVSGVPLYPWESALIIMNHRTRLDWFFLWVALLHGLEHFPRPWAGHRCKFVLKAAIRKIPAIGWIMQMGCFLYIHRKWEMDRLLLGKVLGYFRDIKNRCKILIFPEGTDFSPANKVRSDEFAKKNKFRKYDYVLHPRTTGFTYLAQEMRQGKQLDAIYDITVAYPRSMAQKEVDILHGHVPEEVHFSIKRYPTSYIPAGEDDLHQWCRERWEAKEAELKSFYSGKKRFPNSHPANFPWLGLYLATVGWTLFTFASLYAIYASFIVQIWVVVTTVLFLLISHFTNGIQHLEMGMHWRGRRKRHSI